MVGNMIAKNVLLPRTTYIVTVYYLVSVKRETTVL